MQKWNDQHVMSMGQRKNLSPPQNSNLWPPKHWVSALSTWAAENSWRARPLYWVHIWHASCMLLGSAMSMSQCVVKEWKMVNFKLGETNVKMKWSACHEHKTKKKSESLTGFEPSYDLPNVGFCQTDWLANCLYQKLSGWLTGMYNLLTELLTNINWLSDCLNG